MEVTNKLKERFCKDMNIPIKIFEEPYFESRLRLYDSQFEALKKYEMFKKLLTKFNYEQEYFEEYNKLKDDIISYLGNTEGMLKLKEDDMNKYKIVNEGYPKNDIFKETFKGRFFSSVDMRKANYTSLRHYDKGIVGNTDTYEDFIGLFTDEDYYKQSKYIRQVVFGNHNPKRQVAYEKYLMDSFVTEILKFTDKTEVVYFSNDEVVVDVTDKEEREEYIKLVDALIEEFKTKGVFLRQDYFQLDKVPNTSGYIRKFENKQGYDFKCVDALTMPFILRAYAGEEVQEEDKVFRYEGFLVKLLEIPEVERV